MAEAPAELFFSKVGTSFFPLKIRSQVQKSKKKGDEGPPINVRRISGQDGGP